MAQSGGGQPSRAIAQWVFDTWGIKVSHTYIAKLIREHREERSDAIRDKVVEALAPHITTDLDVLSKWQSRLDTIAESLSGNDPQCALDVDGLVKVVDQLRKLTELKLKHAGATPSDTAQSHTAPVILIPAESED